MRSPPPQPDGPPARSGVFARISRLSLLLEHRGALIRDMRLAYLRRPGGSGWEPCGASVQGFKGSRDQETRELRDQETILRIQAIGRGEVQRYRDHSASLLPGLSSSSALNSTGPAQQNWPAAREKAKQGP